MQSHKYPRIRRICDSCVVLCTTGTQLTFPSYRVWYNIDCVKVNLVSCLCHLISTCILMEHIVMR